MGRFIVNKVLMLIPTFFGVTLLAFSLVHLIPGDPILVLLGQHGISPELHAVYMHQLGLDRPLPVQYASYVGHVLSGNLGTSIRTHQPVWNEFITHFTATAELSVCALILALAIGLPAGIFAALKQRSIYDHTIMGVSLTGYSMPIFWWGLLLIMFFSVYLGWTPVSGRIDVLYDIPRITGFMLIDTLLAKNYGAFVSAISHLILPTIVLGTIPLAVIARMTRSSMLEVLKEDYIRTARAKGLSSTRVVVVHALRNALVPVITIIGLQVGLLLAGAVLTETIFSWPGVGKWLIDSINARDYPSVQGGILMIGFGIVFVNLLVDFLYGFFNPKIRVG